MPLAKSSPDPPRYVPYTSDSRHVTTVPLTVSAVQVEGAVFTFTTYGSDTAKHAGVPLKPGWNAVLVKVANAGKSHRIGLRFAGTDLRTAGVPLWRMSCRSGAVSSYSTPIHSLPHNNREP